MTLKSLLFTAIFIASCFGVNAQEPVQSVTGTIMDKETGKGIPNVTINIFGTNKTTRTDESGKFSFSGLQKGGHMLITHVQYQPLRAKFRMGQPLTFYLVPRLDTLADVVVIGYGTQKRRDVTGAISSVKAKDLENQPVMGIDELLQGRVAGVQVTQTTGEPGGQVEVRIRGASSINAGNEPLFVIDGVPYYNSSQDPGGTSYGTTTPTNALVSLNPGDIESIQVLKDAAATAIYGSRGSNGVIIITTKRGSGEGTKVNYHGYVGTQQVIRKLDVMNAAEHAEFINKWSEANGVPPPFSNPDSLGEGTDWQDEILRTALKQSHQVSLSGRSGKNRYYISGNFYNQDGIIINTNMKRYTFRMNFDRELSDKLTYSHSFTYSKTDSRRVPIAGAGSGNVRSAGQRAIYTSPIFNLYDQDGEYNMVPWFGATKFENPIASLKTTTSNLQRANVTGNITLSYQPVNGLTFKSLLGVHFINTDNKEYYPRSTTYIGGILGGLGFIANRRISNILNENTVNYSKRIRNHSFDLLGGFTVQQERDIIVNNQYTNFPDDRLGVNSINGATGAANYSSSKSQWNLVSLISRLNYQFKNRYLLSASIRADGSSKFSEGKKWGYFPSLAIGYRISEESFLRRAAFIDDLKIRASYGITGNQEVGSYQSLPRLLTDASYVVDGQLVSGSRIVSMANKNLRWEQSAQLDIGLNGEFFNGRLGFALDYYSKKTTDLLFAIDIPATSGYGSKEVLFNTGSLLNEGWEVELNAAILTGKLKWDLGGNFSSNRSTITSLGESPGTTTLFVGRTPGARLGQTYLGIFHSQKEIDDYGLQPDAEPGDMKFADTNGDGKFNANDLLPIGKPIPDFIFGITSTFAYKGFELSIFIESSVGRNGSDIDLLNDPTDLTSNKYRKFIHMWSPANSETASMPGAGLTNYSFSTFDLVDRTYYKLRNINLSYSFPNVKIKSISSLTAYISGQNVITVSDYPGFDPDTGSVGYPPAKVFVFGIKLGF